MVWLYKYVYLTTDKVLLSNLEPKNYKVWLLEYKTEVSSWMKKLSE